MNYMNRSSLLKFDEKTGMQMRYGVFYKDIIISKIEDFLRKYSKSALEQLVVRHDLTDW